MAIADYIHVYQYNALTGYYEAELSGTIVISNGVLTWTPTADYYCNKEIHIVVDVGATGDTTNALQTRYESIFTTVFYPMYSSATLVRLSGGALLDSVEEGTINRLILMHSLAVANIYPKAIDDCDIPWFITRYVTCKVAYDLLSGQAQKYIGSAISKRLGDFEVEGIRDVPGLIRPKLMELIACVETMMKYILNDGSLFADPQWSARAKENIEANTRLGRVPFREPNQVGIENITSEEYFTDGPKPKRLWH